MHLLPQGGALSPGNLWAGQRQASLCLSTEPDPGSEVAGGRETAGEAGDVVWGQGGHQVQAGRGPMWGGVCFWHRSAHASWCPVGSSGCREGVPHSPPQPPPAVFSGAGGGLPCSVPQAISEVLGGLYRLPHPPPGGAEAQSPNLAGASVSALGVRPPNPRNLSPEPPMKKGLIGTLLGSENSGGFWRNVHQCQPGTCLRRP